MLEGPQLRSFSGNSQGVQIAGFAPGRPQRQCRRGGEEGGKLGNRALHPKPDEP